MDLVIPTYGRVDKQVTYNNLPHHWRAKVWLVVREEEEGAHKERGRNVIVLPEGVERIADVRHWLIHKCEQLFHDALVMLDDDMVFAARREDDPTKFRPMALPDYDRMFDALRATMKEYAHAGISHREGANRNTDEFVECSRQMRVLGYQKSVMRANQITGRTEVMEDFDVTLQLLRRGMPNRLLNMWVHNQGGSNPEGGCSTFRTPEVQAASAQKLHALHPQFVKVVEKTTKTSWGGGTRTDVTVYWKKAMKSAVQ